MVGVCRDGAVLTLSVRRAWQSPSTSRRRREAQLTLELPTWGGRRRGAGRKPAGTRRRAPHVAREVMRPCYPVHVTFRMADHVWNLRSQRAFRVIDAALRGAQRRPGLRVVHFSIQGNHLHLIVEGDGARALALRIRGLSVRIARGLNRMMGRSGPVLSDRYDAHSCGPPRRCAMPCATCSATSRATPSGAASGARRRAGWTRSHRRERSLGSVCSWFYDAMTSSAESSRPRPAARSAPTGLAAVASASPRRAPAAPESRTRPPKTTPRIRRNRAVPRRLRWPRRDRRPARTRGRRSRRDAPRTRYYAA